MNFEVRLAQCSASVQVHISALGSSPGRSGNLLKKNTVFRTRPLQQHEQLPGTAGTAFPFLFVMAGFRLRSSGGTVVIGPLPGKALQ